MKYFVVSDIHGHFQELIKALNNAHFNEEKHTLIVLGDMFDRGTESQKVYQYIKRLYDEGKAIVIKGNHELFLLEVNDLNEKRMQFNIEKNGFQFTINSFAEEDVSGKGVSYVKDIIRKKNPGLMEWLDDLPFYYELEEYIFVHAGLNLEAENWKDCDWTKAVWTKTKEFWERDLLEKRINKKVVVGHVGTNRLRRHIGMESEDHSIFISKDNQKIGVDASVYITKRINVFTFHEED